MGRRNISPKVRFQVFKRDNFTCQYCGARPPFCRLEVDHKVPVALGGSHSIDNFVAACSTCNSGKSATIASPPCDDWEWEFEQTEVQKFLYCDPYVTSLWGEPVV